MTTYHETLIRAAERQRNKAIASILTVKDELQDLLSEEDAEYLRKTILDEINHYHNSIVDLMFSGGQPQTVMNEMYLEMRQMIEDIHRNTSG
jgi:3'-phosphoadenosine 5'-phosphosulfate sulfotransferase (PAPS reductase)/FAD synthetase